MKKKLKIISKCFTVCLMIICTSSFCVFADLVEIKNGVKTTRVDKARGVLNTINKHYDFKWALDKKGDWRLYIRRPNGHLISISNTWVNIEREVTNEYDTNVKILDYYYFDYYEKMVTGWLIDISGNTYFLNTNEKELGRMAKGWTKIGDDYYYFNQNGILQRNIITEDGFYVDEEGRWR